MGYSTLFVLVAIVAAGYFLFSARAKQQLALIDSYEFHPSIRKKLSARYPHLSDAQVDLVFDGLRDYFHICHRAGRKMVAMPSQAVDVAWHEFIVFTRVYEQFSKRALGRFLHHTPTEAMSSPTLAQQGIKRAWRLACAKENIDPSAPKRLPLLFAIDGQLEIEDGFRYVLDCTNRAGVGAPAGYCAGHIGCASGCGGDSGGSGDGAGSSCGGGCGGGD